VILVNSDVLIEHLRGNTAARDGLVRARQSSGPLAISVLSLTEIAGGLRSPERREVIRLLGSMHRFEVSEQVAWRAATLLRGHRRSHTGIGLGDYPIAATALTEGIELVTLSIRDYPMFPGLARPFPRPESSQPNPGGGWSNCAPWRPTGDHRRLRRRETRMPVGRDRGDRRHAYTRSPPLIAHR
jgi:predicted nucleic acid-binding protein